MGRAHKPTQEELLAAEDGTVPDAIAPGLRVLFCGINPSLYSAVVGYHFARPGNRFWPTLHRAGFTERRLKPEEWEVFLKAGYGLTNVVARATARADELSAEELRAGRGELERKVKEYRPQILAVLGIGAYRTAFEERKAVTGRQPRKIGDTTLWVLPNPSGLNAHYQLDDLARLYREVLEAVGRF